MQGATPHLQTGGWQDSNNLKHSNLMGIDSNTVATARNAIPPGHGYKDIAPRGRPSRHSVTSRKFKDVKFQERVFIKVCLAKITKLAR